MGKDSTYSDVAKTNVVFGGVKVLQMIVTFLKAKVVAMCLGPAGIGVQSLLDHTINTLYQFSNLGTAQSGVRAISYEKGDEGKLKAAKAVEILSIILGLLATIICFVFARHISIWVFGEETYTNAFRIVSISVLFLSIKYGQITLFQGYQNVKFLANAALIAAVLSFLVAVPLVYFGGEAAIPYMIVASFGVAAVPYIIFRKKKLPSNKSITPKDALKSSGPIIGLGVALMLSNTLMAAFSLILASFIKKNGSSSDVGLYQAANACTYLVINILVSILASDFYPRISSVAGNSKKISSLLSAQVELLFLLLVPIVLSMELVPTIYIRLLYSSSFLIIVNVVRLMAISLLFRIIWHSFSYVILAHGDKITYFLCDALVGNGLFFIGNIIGFKYNGLDGIALSYVIFSFVVMMVLGVVILVRYKVSLNKTVIIHILSLITISVSFYFIGLLRAFNPLYVQVPVFIIVSVFCLKKYNDHSNVFSKLLNKLWNKRK